MLFKIIEQPKVVEETKPFVKPKCQLSWPPKLTRQPKVRVPNDDVFEALGLEENPTFKVLVSDLIRQENIKPRLWLKGVMREELYSLKKGETVFTRLHFQNESYGRVFVIFNGETFVYPTETYGGSRLKNLVFYDPAKSVLSTKDSDKVEEKYRLLYFP